MHTHTRANKHAHILTSTHVVCACIQVFSWILCAIFSLLFVTITSTVNRRFENGNLYHLEKKKWSPHMRALVLNAGKLDEAALALSTEPLVRAYLMPSLKVRL